MQDVKVSFSRISAIEHIEIMLSAWVNDQNQHLLSVGML